MKHLAKSKLPHDSLAYELLVATRVLEQVLSGTSLPIALNNCFSALPLAQNTKGAVQQITYLTLRHLGIAKHIAKQLIVHSPKPTWINTFLYIAFTLLTTKDDNNRLAYPHHTLIHQAVQAISSSYEAKHARGFVNALLRRLQREEKSLLETKNNLEAKWNYPLWWIKQVQQYYPNDWESILTIGNQPPPLTLRVNIQKISPTDYVKELEKLQIPAQIIGPYAVKLQNAVSVDEIFGFKEGLVSVQDAAAQLAAPLLPLKDGMRVLDACAAPGGKTSHLLERNNLDLVALDISQERLVRIQENLDRLNLVAQTKQGDATKQDWWDKKSFDCILADVPCTASGIVRRHPDIRWLRRPEDSHTLSQLSQQILDNLWGMLASGGYFLFCTCSIWPQESSEQAKAFIKRHDAIPLVAYGQLIPTVNDKIDLDGLFYALFQKR